MTKLTDEDMAVLHKHRVALEELENVDEGELRIFDIIYSSKKGEYRLVSNDSVFSSTVKRSKSFKDILDKVAEIAKQCGVSIK